MKKETKRRRRRRTSRLLCTCMYFGYRQNKFVEEKNVKDIDENEAQADEKRNKRYKGNTSSRIHTPSIRTSHTPMPCSKSKSQCRLLMIHLTMSLWALWNFVCMRIFVVSVFPSHFGGAVLLALSAFFSNRPSTDRTSLNRDDVEFDVAHWQQSMYE